MSFRARILAVFLFSAASMLSAVADSVAFFYALDQELDAIKQAARGPVSSSRVGSRTVTHLRFGSHKVDCIKMGSGCVEAAISAQALLAQKPYDLAISAGPAGSLSAASITGHWYRVTRALLWQKGSETPGGFQLKSDQDFALTSAYEDVLASAGVALSGTGTIAAGEAFIASATRRQEIGATTGATLVDMNSAGIAAACSDHRVPLIMLRIVSDEADEAASGTFRAFLDRYDGEGGRLAARIIQHLPPNPERASSYPEIRSRLDNPLPGPAPTH